MILPNTLGPPELYYQIYGGLPGGVYQYIIYLEQLEDDHLKISVRENFVSPPTPQDYFKIAFYSYTMDRASREQILVAIDQTKYYFQENFPFNSQFPSPPTTPTNFQVIFQRESDNPYFLASWATSTDPDSLDWEINYQIDYWPENNPDDKKQWTGRQNSAQITILSSGNYIFELKAFDEFDLYSPITFASSSAIIPVILAEQTCGNSNTRSFGGGNSYGPHPTEKIAQSFEIKDKTRISSFTIGLSNCNNCYLSGAKISLRNAKNNSPSEPPEPSDEIIYSTSLSSIKIRDYYEFKNFSFYLDIDLEPGTYFLVLEPENSPSNWPWNLISRYCSGPNYTDGSFYAFSNNQWRIEREIDLIFQVKGIF
ncbi:hypothetical protein COS61_02005 [Candidatus Wolfebacteria bacterium CG03_land_8_20_14_0_80_40_12]|uniref:Uncharacterized protein n=1 Tax=Candidatus Wolfebacteria bacterium CG03_land_8_20_14_0_80_40_12 TaxID=1975069 RepID=A0A2M7B5D6_9BACT|nr:MAG: hypothetical protein COS61_02005 [Candidatus Wolfebacteria bacterium CG03_land_8_20_14_0_80_40_12]